MRIASAAPSPRYTEPVAEPVRPRVRQQARDAVTVMAFSAATSVGFALAFLLLALAAHRA